MRGHIAARRSLSLWVAVCLLTGLLAWPASAQEDAGRGVIVYLDGNSMPFTGFEAWGCSNAACARSLGLLYATLFDGILLDPPALPAAEQVYTVNSDLTWSDGTPITAYDAAYSLLSRESLVFNAASPLTGLRIDDETHLTLAFAGADCATNAYLDSMVLPAHSFNPDFRAFADQFSGPDGDIASPREWRDSFDERRDGAQWLRFPKDNAALVTGGQFSLVVGDGRNLAYIKRDALVLDVAGSGRPALQGFLGGNANVLLDPPFDQRVDLRATPGLQIYEAPSYAVDYLVFNQSDSNYPRDAFVEGEPLEQLPHPFFADVRVRRAIQMAINVDELIDGALYGSGVPLNGAFSPVSWAYDPTIQSPLYDPNQAERLLDEAGWRDVDGDGYRECFNCLNARPGVPLAISLAIEDNDDARERVGNLLRIQLARVGVDLYPGGGDGEYQNFDLLLTGTNGASPLARDPDLYRLFAREWDRVGIAGGNVGSVNNPPLEALLDEARHVPGCDVDARAAIYRQAQTLLREDVPAIWLYARNDMYVARGIDGFAPRPGQPFWNITDWRVAR